MSAAILRVRFTNTRHASPLAEVDGLPGGSAELTPGQLRDLAATLVRVAADAEARPKASRGTLLRDYPVGVPS